MHNVVWIASLPFDGAVGIALAAAATLGWLALGEHRHPSSSAEPTVFETLLERVAALRRPDMTIPYRSARSARLRAQRLTEARQQMFAERGFIRRQTR